ncbi:MAG: hypothetical protein H0T84_11565 [Tatlockia sp.]|nr:hypothetical protein [Tatlockia sp.]
MKIISILSLSLLALQAQASWPTFFYPDRQLIMDLNYFDNSGCSWGNVKLKPGIINVSSYTCEEYCPPEWDWTAKTDGKCHSLAELDFRQYNIVHYTDYDSVTAVYGPRSSSEIFFEYEMHTKPGTFWYCTQYKNRMDYVVCGNDTLRRTELRAQ